MPSHFRVRYRAAPTDCCPWTSGRRRIPKVRITVVRMAHGDPSPYLSLVTVTDRQRLMLHRRGLRLEYATIAWNVGEAFLTIGLGLAAGSLALIGFGSVSVIEVFASLVVVWHMVPGHGHDDPRRTRHALRLTSGAFGALSIALVAFALRDLLTGRVAGESPWGIAYLAVTAVVMFGLAFAKRSIADRLDSAPLRSEAKMTFLDGVLSTATLVGLALNAVAGMWWADPLAALLVGIAAGNEARHTWAESTEDPTREASMDGALD